MTDKDKVITLLKNYRSYRYAVQNGVAPFVEEDALDVRVGSGFGPRPPRGFGGRGSLAPSLYDYQQYKHVVQLIDGAVRDVLDDAQQKVIQYKYLERNTLTLREIGYTFFGSEDRAKYLHRKALHALTLALKFVDVPEIHNLDWHLDKMTV